MLKAEQLANTIGTANEPIATTNPIPVGFFDERKYKFGRRRPHQQ